MANASRIFQDGGRASVSICMSSRAGSPLASFIDVPGCPPEPCWWYETFWLTGEFPLMPSLQRAPRERQSAQARHLLWVETLGRDQNVETLAHAGGSYQVLELQ